MIRGSHVRDVGRPSECSLNLAAALQDLRRIEDIQWVVEKLEAAGLKEKRHIGGTSGTRRKKEKAFLESIPAPSATDRHLRQATDDGAIPVEDLKRIIRQLKLNTGQSFWKNHVTREDLFEVLLSHFKARNPTRKASHSIKAGIGGPAVKHATGATNIERMRHELVSARMRDDSARQESESSNPSLDGGMSPFRSKMAGRDIVKPKAPAKLPPSAHIGWRGFDIAETRGIVYQMRVGQGHDRHRTREFALHRRLSGGHWIFKSETDRDNSSAAHGGRYNRADGLHLDGSDTSENLDDDAIRIEGHGEKGAMFPNETPQNTSTKDSENDTTAMKRKCAMSLYEMTTDPDKGPLLVEHGVLRALSDLSEVEDPQTMRYVGASYVNIAGFSLHLCGVMLKNQVVRCLHRLWFRGVGLAYPRHRGNPHAPIEHNGATGSRLSSVDETEEHGRARRCGLDVVDQTAEALCRLSMVLGSESVIAQEGGVDAIVWCAGNDHGNERLSVAGLQCLVNFHLSFPTRSLNEVVVPCLARLAQSTSMIIRKFTGHSICALADNKHGASHLLAGGVLSILASLPGVPGDAQACKAGDSGGRSAGPEDFILESQVASMLAQAKDEFVRQTITAPETVAKLLDTLYLGGEGCSGHRESRKERGTTGVPAACRLSSARVLISIFSAVDEADMVRIVQLGFLTTAARFLRQAESLQDQKAEELLSHSLWCLSLNLTEIRCLTPPAPPTIDSAGRQGVSQVQDLDGKSSAQETISSVPGKAGSKHSTRSGDPQEIPGSHHPYSKVTKAGHEETPEVARSAASLCTRVPPSSGSSAVVWGAERPTGSAAVSNDVDGSSDSGGARNALGRSGAEALGGEGAFGVAGEGGTAFHSAGNQEAELMLASQGWQKDGQADTGPASQDEPEARLHIVECGVMHHLLRLAESGSSSYSRYYSVGALCNLGLKPWVTADICKEIGIARVLITSIGVELAAGEDRTSALAAKALWSLVSQRAEDTQFIEDCLALGVVGSLCDAIKGAAGVSMVSTTVSTMGFSTTVGEEKEGGGGCERVPPTGSNRVSGRINAAATEAGSTAANTSARTQKDTVEACLRILHAILKHKWVRSDPVVRRSKKHLLTTLASCGVEAIQVDEIVVAIMCNLTHDVCCDIDLVGRTGALQHVFRQALSPSRAVLKHVAGVLGNLAHVLQPTPTGCRAVEGNEVVTVFDVLKRLTDMDEQRLAFRSSAILYELTRRRNYAIILPDLKGLSDIVFKLFRCGLPQTQNYCFQAFFNMTRNEDFAMAIAKSHLMEAFIVGRMVYTASSNFKEVHSEVLYYLISNRWTRPTALERQGLRSLVQLATVSRGAVPMRLALLATFNLAASDLQQNDLWLDELTVAAVLEFDDEVLGAPAYPGLLYLASTHHGCLQKALLTKRMGREAKAKIEGAKFLKRDRAQEEDEKFMATVAKEARSNSAEEPEESPFEEEELHDERLVTTVHSPTQRSRLRHTFVASHLLPTLATVYNLCRKNVKATKLFCREGVPEAIAGLLEEMREADDDACFHPQVEILSVAVLGCMIEDVGLVAKLIERRVTPAIVQGLGSRVSAVRLSSLWYVFLLGIPVAEARSSSPAPVGEEKFRSWMLFCRQAVIECNAVKAMWMLWDETAASLNAEAREHVRYAISTTVNMFSMNQMTAAAVVEQRGAELLAMTTENPWALKYTLLQPSSKEELLYDNGSSPIAQVSALCCAVLAVYSPGIPVQSVQSVCEGCLGVLLKILPTEDNDVRDLCSLVMICLAGKEDLLLDLMAEPRFTIVMGLLLRGATMVGGAYIRAILQRVVVLSAAPDVADLSPALLELTDYAFSPRNRNRDDDALLTTPANHSRDIQPPTQERSTRGGARGETINWGQLGGDSDAFSETDRASDQHKNDEIRQVQRLIFRVVEAELPATAEDTVEEGIDQLREVTTRACQTFQRTSVEFRKNVSENRKGQALPLPCAPSATDIGTSGENTTAPETAQSNEAESLPSRLWDPAKDILDLAGMQGLEMVPSWECANPQAFLQRSGSDGGGGGDSTKVTLCTARFTENGKSLICPDVAIPSPLPEELRATPDETSRRDRAMPFGVEPCILTPLERCGLEVMPEPSDAHGSNANNASASVTSIGGSDIVGNSEFASSDDHSSTGLPCSKQVRSLHSNCSGDNKATGRGSLPLSGLPSNSGRKSRGGGRDNDDPTNTRSDDEMSEKALQAATIRPSREGSEEVSAGARDCYSLPSASGGCKHRERGGLPSKRAQHRDGRANHGGSTTCRQDFEEVRAGIGTAVSGRARSDNALDFDGRSQLSVAGADNEDDAARTRESDARVPAGVACSPAASPTVAGFSWSGYAAVPPHRALPLRRARTSADVGTRRAAQALACDTMSLRARRRTEGRNAGQQRQEVFKSLGVGRNRTVRIARDGHDGQGKQVMLVKVLPPAQQAPSLGVPPHRK